MGVWISNELGRRVINRDILKRVSIGDAFCNEGLWCWSRLGEGERLRCEEGNEEGDDAV